MKTYLRNPDFDCRREEDGNHIAFNRADGKGFTMNATSYRIWELCDGTRSSEAITTDVLKGCESTVPADVQEIIGNHLSTLVHTGLIQEQDTAQV